ncbi:MAG TPA: crossover junction endodeoxyribonuclease RuvC [Candidatus Dormibacteraeota bacterium]|nr:crossover junction endodeoxyribonuclease RuvC [Candidatus Dormibacteraeota bacterium]
MIILGLDPGLVRTGYGVIETGTRGEEPRLVEAGVVEPGARGSLEGRLARLFDGVRDALIAAAPEVMVVEELYTVYRNPQTAILMGHARGVCYLAAGQAGIPVGHLGHSAVKRALVGHGTAKKEQVGKMVAALLHLRAVPEPNDVSDALALALAYANVRQHEERLRSIDDVLTDHGYARGERRREGARRGGGPQL